MARCGTVWLPMDPAWVFLLDTWWVRMAGLFLKECVVWVGVWGFFFIIKSEHSSASLRGGSVRHLGEL